MQDDLMQVRRMGPLLGPDTKRVLLRRYFPSSDSIARRIMDAVETMPAEVVQRQLLVIKEKYAPRHKRPLDAAFEARYLEVCARLGTALLVSACMAAQAARRALCGSYFMHEYSIESAALFNPSIVPHHDQSGLPEGTVRFILSLRATGEGHISSITFRTGYLTKEGRIGVERPRLRVAEPLPQPDGSWAFPKYCRDISERVIFPVTPAQSNGVEDARFVRFTEDDGSVKYYATYTAYNGRDIMPEMIETTDFGSLRFVSLSGDISNKGMALFPRRVNGRYMLLSRQDDVNILVMSSESLYKWHNPQIIVRPEQPWEQFKMGNCGSPIETSRGWLVLTHGVGPLREYALGAVLLDLNDPTKVVGRLSEPLIRPNESEREGYVPNVVYTCGGMLHNDLVIIPYAVSDTHSTFAYIKLNHIFAAMGLL